MGLESSKKMVLLYSLRWQVTFLGPKINIDFVIATGHMSGGHRNTLDEAAVVYEHFGAIEWKEDFSTGGKEFKVSEKLEPMWTMANSSDHYCVIHNAHPFEGVNQDIGMAPKTVNGGRSKWYGGSSIIRRSLYFDAVSSNFRAIELYHTRITCGPRW
ncbi:hypothetical protein F5146DRAFT_1034450 [Armillaria mellea]|nr:hypothetical protein F5146DRAFT_1034450 [Armillaria mellea]